MPQKPIRKGMILCAGLGTRLLPITQTLPKPLVPILNIENVLFNIHLMQSNGIKQIMVNLHHLPSVLEEFLVSHPQVKAEIHFSREATILGTGGGVKKAEAFFEGEAFVLANCDFVTNTDLNSLIAEHQRKENLATMLLIQDEHRQRKYSKVGITDKGHLCSLPKLETRKPSKHGIFTGIHVIEAECLKFLKSEPCGINDLMYPALMKKFPERVGGHIDNQHFWYDTGEVDTFLASSAGLLSELSKNPTLVKTLETLMGKKLIEHSRGVWAPSDTEIPPKTTFQGTVLLGSKITFHGGEVIGPNVVIGDGCKLGASTKLSDCVVFPQSSLESGADVRECLIYQEHVLKPTNR